MSAAILGVALLAGLYFIAATAVGITTGYDPFESTTPLEYRIFLWPAAKVWSAIFPGNPGGQ